VSRGPGTLQKRIVDEIARTSAKSLPWTALRRRFPRQARDRSLYRAVHSLQKRDLVFDHYVGGRRYVALTAQGDTELLALYEAAHAQLAAVARARGVPVPPLTQPASPKHKPQPASPEREVDA
jgi:hypothetical protein